MHPLAVLLFLMAEASAVCTLPDTFPPLSPRDPRLPDPWKLSSTNQSITTIEDFKCRQQEWSQMLQQFELGDLPPPPSSVTASISGATLTTRVTMPGNRTFSFASKIVLPPSYTPGTLIPAVIGLGSIQISLSSVPPLARILFDNDACASQSGPGSRGRGYFYDSAHGSRHSAGAFMAWAWCFSRLVDGLATLPPDMVKIDTNHVAVTGCSRNAKGALVIGAFEPRVALTIPQESGPGAAACWRILHAEGTSGRIRIPEDPGPPTASTLAEQNPWFSRWFDEWARRVEHLPFDHHFLAGLIAPRGLFVLENDIQGAVPQAAAGCMRAAKEIYDGVGVGRNMGYSNVGGHQHCQFPRKQEPDLHAFVERFLFGRAEQEKDVMVGVGGSWAQWRSGWLPSPNLTWVD